MFKFLKDMVDAIKEGAAEGAAEAKEEAGAAAAAKEKSMSEGAAEAERLLALTSQPERVATALAAPYRETFLDEFSNAADQKRPPVYLFSASLPDNEIKSWKSLLNRDFDIENAEDAEIVIEALIADITPETATGDVAVAVVRSAHIATASAGVGFIGAGQALEWSRPLVELAAARFSSWPEFGQAFLTGEAKAAGSNFVGRKVLAGAVKRLIDDPAGPWQTLDWPKPSQQQP